MEDHEEAAVFPEFATSARGKCMSSYCSGKQRRICEFDSATKKQKYERIMEVKMATPVEVLCNKFPIEFRMYFEYVRTLRFEDLELLLIWVLVSGGPTCPHHACTTHIHPATHGQSWREWRVATPHAATAHGSHLTYARD